MKILAWVLAAGALSLLNVEASAQRIEWKPVTPGNMQWGNVPQGTIYRPIGPITYGSDGSWQHRSGNTTRSSDGSVGQHLGDVFVERAPDGTKKTCRQIGENTFCSWQ